MSWYEEGNGKSDLFVIFFFTAGFQSTPTPHRYKRNRRGVSHFELTTANEATQRSGNT